MFPILVCVQNEVSFRSEMYIQQCGFACFYNTYPDQTVDTIDMRIKIFDKREKSSISFSAFDFLNAVSIFYIFNSSCRSNFYALFQRFNNLQLNEL